jgi:hypothetical protein
LETIMSPAPARRSFASALIPALAALAACSSGGSAPGPAPGACALPPAAALSIVEVSPADDATGAFVGTNVSLRFNTCLDAATVTSANVWLIAGPTYVSAALRYEPATATVIIDPIADLGYSRLHLVAVNGVRGARGELLQPSFASSFTTQATPETVPPTTVASPPGGRYKAPLSVTLACTDNPGGTGCAATHYTVDGSTPTRASPIHAGPISIAADTVLRFFSVDAQGNAEAPRQETYVLDTVPPSLDATDPANGATGVPLTRVLGLTFSEEMDPATFAASVSADNALTFALSWSAATRTLTLTPHERLVCGTTYTVAVGPGATDLAGNALVQPASFAFTTHLDCEEPVTSASLAGGAFTAAQSVTLTCTDGGGSGCARIVYTTDGSLPSLVPPNGTIVSGASAGPISIGVGDTVLRWFAEDAAGNGEVLRERRYAVSTSGFTFVAMSSGIARGVGPVPTRFEPLLPGGRTLVFARDPSNGRLYRGTERGLLVSDGGESFAFLPGTWTPVLSVLPLGSKVFAGTSSGLLVSTDGGATFAPRAIGGAGWVLSIVADGPRVWAATDGGVALSVDRGRTFVLRTTSDGLGSNTVRALALEGGKLYAATAGGISISEDGGESFGNVGTSTGLPNASVRSLVVSGSTVYAGTDSGLSISQDGAQTFPVTRTTTNGLGSNHVGVLAFDGTRLYAGTGEPWVSGTSNSFSISTDATGASFTPRPLSTAHPTLRAESTHVEGSTVRVGAYPNYYLSTDGGVSFASMELRSAVRKVTGTGSTLLAAISDSSGHGGVAISTDRGRSFVMRGKEHGIPSTNVDHVAASGQDVFAATFSGLGDSADGGSTFVTRAVNAPAGSNVDCLWAGGSTVWACAGTTLNMSSNSGLSFEQRLTGASSSRGLAVSGTAVYLATTDGLWSSPTGAAGTFTRRGTAQGLGSDYLNDVAVDGAGTILAATNSDLSVSIDGGVSFTRALARSPRGVLAHGTTWYVAHASGLAISQNGGSTWTELGPAEGVASANGVWFMP